MAVPLAATVSPSVVAAVTELLFLTGQVQRRVFGFYAEEFFVVTHQIGFERGVEKQTFLKEIHLEKLEAIEQLNPCIGISLSFERLSGDGANGVEKGICIFAVDAALFKSQDREKM